MKALQLAIAVSMACIQRCCSIHAVPLLSPPTVQSEGILMSPEDLVAATLPWQGMGSPWKSPSTWSKRHPRFSRSTAPVHNPWDIGVDEFISSGGSHTSGTGLATHMPPIIADSRDLSRVPSQPTMDQMNYKTVSLQPMPISGPAMVAHGYKPTGFYADPAAGPSGVSLLQIRSRARVRAREGSYYLTAPPTLHPVLTNGILGFTQGGSQNMGPDMMRPPEFQPAVSAERHFRPNKRLMWDSFDAQAMSKVAPTVGASSWMIPPVFDFTSADTDQLNQLLHKAPKQRAKSGYEEVPMWPGRPPRPLFD